MSDDQNLSENITDDQQGDNPSNGGNPGEGDDDRYFPKMLLKSLNLTIEKTPRPCRPDETKECAFIFSLYVIIFSHR